MQPHRMLVPLALAALALGGAAAVPARADGACAQRTSVYLYTSDSQDLVRQLATTAASCADYYVSVAPYTSGANAGRPKGGAALAVVHQQGPQFHALAEIRMKAWCAYAAVNGWYATGQLLHDAMLAEGYDPARDTWAVNEVGTPSDASCQTDVFAGADGARQGFRDFVGGLHDGLPGETPLAGVVLAASPIQLTADPWTYEQGLAGWYADAPFWQDMERDVAVWAQETYADARAWGVAGSTPAERAAALNSYFLHGLDLATSGGAATAAAQEFLARAYTPLGNASFRRSAPVDPGPGYGATPTDPALMWNFVSTQVYALRSSTGSRFGFAVTPNDPGGAAVRLGVEAHLGAAIRDSQDDPLGACTEPGESCDGSVEDASFPQTWPSFATPPRIVARVQGPLGSGGWYTGDVTVSWDVTDAQTPVTSPPCEPVTISADTAGTPLTCTAASSGGTASATVTIRRDATPPAVTCAPTPATLWPPNGRLVPVSVQVAVTDATSGPDGFALTAAPAAGAADFALGTADVAGLLQARRAGDGGDRVYTLTYTGRDVAGNAAACDATVAVPHDRGE